MTAGPGPAPTAPVTLGARLLNSVLAQTAVLTAGLYYLGWSRLFGYYGFFGVDVRLLSLPVTDTVTSAAHIGLPVLTVAGLLGTVAFVAVKLADSAAHGHPHAVTAVGTAYLSGGAFLLLVGWLYLQHVETSVWAPLRPATVGAGALLLMHGYAVLAGQFPWPSATPGVGAVVLVVAGTSFFQSMTIYAQLRGQDRAIQIADHLGTEADIWVYAPAPLAVTDPDIKPEQAPPGSSAYPVVYKHLRLVGRAANGDLYLVSSSWKRGVSPVVQVPAEAKVRLEVRYPCQPAGKSC
jgi:hypothetical protein